MGLDGRVRLDFCRGGTAAIVPLRGTIGNWTMSFSKVCLEADKTMWWVRSNNQQIQQSTGTNGKEAKDNGDELVRHIVLDGTGATYKVLGAIIQK